MTPQGEGKSRSDQSDNIEFNFCGVSFVSSTLFYFMVYFVQVHNPLRLLLVLSCVLLLTCLAARFTCEPNLEDHLVIAALVLAWPYSLTFCRCDNKFTLFCPLKHYLLAKCMKSQNQHPNSQILSLFLQLFNAVLFHPLMITGYSILMMNLKTKKFAQCTITLIRCCQCHGLKTAIATFLTVTFLSFLSFKSRIHS